MTYNDYVKFINGSPIEESDKKFLKGLLRRSNEETVMDDECPCCGRPFTIEEIEEEVCYCSRCGQCLEWEGISMTYQEYLSNLHYDQMIDEEIEREKLNG